MAGTDEQLVRQLLAGDRRAFRRFYESTKNQVMGYARQRVDSVKDAEELVHDAYLAMLDSLPLFRGKSTVKTFLMSILRHELADYWRKRYAKSAIKTVPFVDQVYTERLYSAKKTALVIERVYGQLQPWERKVLRLKYEEGLSVKQIARMMDWTVKAAESRLFRARRSFQLAYEVTSDKA
jgi:RNA polymerase sigma-70 factor (ECF subfamily)